MEVRRLPVGPWLHARRLKGAVCHFGDLEARRMEIRCLHARHMEVRRWHLEDLEAERLAKVSCRLRRADGSHRNPPVPPFWSSNHASAATLVKRLAWLLCRPRRTDSVATWPQHDREALRPGYRVALAAWQQWTS